MQGGMEKWRDGGRDGGLEGGMESWKDGEKEAGMEGGMEEAALPCPRCSLLLLSATRHEVFFSTNPWHPGNPTDPAMRMGHGTTRAE